MASYLDSYHPCDPRAGDESGEESGVESRLSGAVSEARRRAGSLRRPVLLRVHGTVEATRLEALLEAADDAGVGWFFWRDPTTGHTLAAVDSLGAPHSESETIARSGGCFAVAEQIMDVPLDAGERFERPSSGRPQAVRVGGFAFGSSLPCEAGVWAGWPWRHLPAPAIQLQRVAPLGDGRGHREDDVAEMVISAVVTGRSVASEVLGQIRHALALVRACPRTHAAEPSAFGVPTPEPEDPAEREAWRHRVGAALETFENGALRKVVLARRHGLVAPTGHVFDPLETLRALQARHPTCFTFGIGRPDGRAFVGSTPELLVRVHDGVLETVAMAGTAPPGETADEAAGFGRALLESAKDREEHDIVVEAIRSALGPLCDGLEVSSTPSVRRLTHLQHLVTPIRGRLRAGTTILDVAAALHPTPAVGGVPRPEALTWLRENEGLERGWYAAPVGWVGAGGDGVLAVGIRSAVLHGGSAHAFVGAGLVPGSDADAEWEETSLKLQAVASGLRTRGWR